MYQSLSFKARERIIWRLKDESENPYGALHLRTHFLLENVPNSQIQTVLGETIQKAVQCIEHFSSPAENRGASPIRTWWILSDNAEIAKSLTNAVMEQQQQSAGRAITYR